MRVKLLKRRSDGRNNGQYPCYWTWQCPYSDAMGWEQNAGFLDRSTVVGSESKLSSNQRSRSTGKSRFNFLYLSETGSNCKENSWLIRADFELLDTADKVFAYIRKDGDRRFLVVANLSNEEQGLTVEGNVKSVLIENTASQESLWKTNLVSMGCFLCGITINLFTEKFKNEIV